MKKAFITGGTGFVGGHLIHLLLEKGYRVVAVGRSAKPASSRENLEYISADTTIKGAWQETLKTVDLVINLAGASIFHYWTASYKKSIHTSRILTTRHLVEALAANQRVTFVSTSAMGFYGSRDDDLLTENEPVGEDFLAEVCRDWEAEALQAAGRNARVIIARFSTVVDKSGGAMKVMLPPYRFFVGGPMGSGKQWFPWIHLQDLLSALMFLIDNDTSHGAYNFCAPESIRNVDMARTLGRLLHRPALLRVPAFAMGLLMGEFGRTLLGSQNGIPQRLIDEGFQFRFPGFESAMKEVLGK